MRKIILALGLSLSVATAGFSQGDNIDVRPNLKGGYQAPEQNNQPEENKKSAPVGAYLIAILGSALVLTIICYPSRKQ